MKNIIQIMIKCKVFSIFLVLKTELRFNKKMVKKYYGHFQMLEIENIFFYNIFKN